MTSAWSTIACPCPATYAGRERAQSTPTAHPSSRPTASTRRSDITSMTARVPGTTDNSGYREPHESHEAQVDGRGRIAGGDVPALRMLRLRLAGTHRRAPDRTPPAGLQRADPDAPDV